MADARSDMTETIIRFGKALAIHALLAVVTLALIWLFTSHYNDASESVRNQNSDPQAIGSLLDGARGQLYTWLGISMFVSFLASGLFLAIAQRRHPPSPIEGKGELWLWTLMLLIVLSFAAVFWYSSVSTQGIGSTFASGSYALALASAALGTFLAYYLATALAVTLTMKPSVPLASILPNFWN